MSQSLKGIIADLTNYLADDEIIDPIGYLESLLLRLQGQAEVNELFGQDVAVRLERGFRYQVSDSAQWTSVSRLDSYAEACELARDIVERLTGGTATYEIVRRVVMTSDWKPLDLDALAALAKEG